ncbi:MAG: hypothetical protein M1812_001816 [Candelaria pacifica]|nr:MAG: hypothetical protein M1812_001816 [Candelaria pacifica]
MATANAAQSLEYGTKIVGGVTPGKNEEHLGLPVLPTAKERLKPDATAIFVAARHAGKAIEEAIEAEIPLIVAVAEHVPLHDVLRVDPLYLKNPSKSRFVGPNCPGIISPIGNCRIGFQPLPIFSAGCVAIVAKSGTLSYETVASTTRAGLGQSLVIGVGGDVLPGTSFVDALRVFKDDESTKGIIIVGEIGGQAEQDAAEWIGVYRKRTKNPKPILGLVAGLEAPPNRVMGHAGAFVGPGEADAAGKIRSLREAGVKIVKHPAMFGSKMRTLLEERALRIGSSLTTVKSKLAHDLPTLGQANKEPSLHLTDGHLITTRPHRNNRQTVGAFDLLRGRDISIAKALSQSAEQLLLAVSIDRKNLCPCIIASRVNAAQEKTAPSCCFPFDYRAGLDQGMITTVAQHLMVGAGCDTKMQSLSCFLQELVTLFMSKEASLLQTEVTFQEDGGLQVQKAKFGFDDAAHKSGRQADIHRLRDVKDEIPAEFEAEVNGAGLAMNTNDALAAHGAKCANFLDTGGRATSDTVKSSFRILLQDLRVKASFVNIFGGLTLCDMIAEGIMMAFQDLKMKIPVVVRLRGTNEEAGQRMIAENGLPLHAFDDFEDAAKKVIALAREAE